MSYELFRTQLAKFFAEDKRIKQPVGNEISQGLYNKLLKSSQSKLREQKEEILQGLYDERLKSSQSKILEQKLANVRPSGSDLRNAFQEMKNIAYYMDEIQNNKLNIDKNVLNVYSPEIRNN